VVMIQILLMMQISGQMTLSYLHHVCKTATQLESNKKSQGGVECLSEIVWITD